MLSLVLGWPREAMPERSRTLVARADAVWIWPGIPLTLRRGIEIVPVAAETIRFWITRLHGPDALDKDILRAVANAAQYLKAGDESGAQTMLDALRLTELSYDGEALMCAVADHLGVEALDLPLRASLRTWTAQDIALHLPIFKRHAEAARVLAKGGIPFDPQKHPRWPAGTPELQGGRFAPANSENPQIVDVQYRGHFHDEFVDYLVNLQREGGGIAIKSVPLTTVTGITCVADALMKPPGQPVFILEVKTGDDPTFTFSQALCYPWAVLGNHVTSINPEVTQLGLLPGLPFPSMNVVVMRAKEPGQPFFGDIITRDNLEGFLKKLLQMSGRH